MHRFRSSPVPAPYWNPPDDGGGGGSDAAAAAAAAAAAGGGAWKAPEGLPPELLGKDAAETLGKLMPVFTETTTRANGLRDKLATLPKAPEKPEAYPFAPSDKLKPFFQGDLTQNPVLNQAKAAFHKAGVGEKQFQSIVEEIYTPLIEAGVLAAPYDPQAEIRAFRDGYGLDETAAKAAMTEADTFSKGLVGQLQGIPEPLKKAAEAEFKIFSETAGGMAVLRALKARLGDSGIRIPDESTGGSQGGPLTREQLKEMAKDPRIDPANKNSQDPAKKYDPELRKRYDAGYAAAAASGAKG